MRARVAIGRFIIRLSTFLKSMAIMVMRPDDLIEFSRQTYSDPEMVQIFCGKDVVESGLYYAEKDLLERIPLKKGRLLLLGIGGGREAISLGEMGFDVTGIDYVKDMVDTSCENASKKGLSINGRVQEISKLDIPDDSFNVAWLTGSMYSSIPTQKKRIATLKKIKRALVPGGYFICQFYWNKKIGGNPKAEFLRKMVAFLTIGNLWYESGDFLMNNKEFMHAFSSKNEIMSEFEKGGFKVIYSQIIENENTGGVVLTY